MTETTQVPLFLSDAHRAYLNEHAISDEIITAACIWSSGDDIVFPWRDDGSLTAQRRTWPEPDEGLPAGVPKYRWEAGHALHLAAWRPMRGGKGPVIICEGTKQALAVASWAPPEYAVYGMAGCDGWVNEDPFRFENRPVIIFLDRDAADNLNVWEAGEKLAELLETADAKPAFVHMPGRGTDGIDDYLAAVPASQRTDRLARLIAKAGSKPAKTKPSHRKMGDQVPDTGGRPLIVVNEDRAVVIRAILGRMRELWDGTSLFSYGGALTRLRYGTGETAQGAATEPLDKDSLARWVAEAAFTCKYRPPGANSPGTYEPSWPEPLTMGAVLASGDEFAPLDRISRTPFIRADGSVCAKQGYDEASRTMLVTGNSGMDRLDIPDQPSQEDARQAAAKLLDDWLGDDPVTGKHGMPWRDPASRANALALVLTPFIRGIVPLAPLAMISGLQMGVGKNLLADCLSLMATGENIQPLPWIPDDDDEIRKQITAAFRAGSPLMCFDEAHVIGGSALTRAITATTYADRILGVSKMASYPNRVTWIALGNQMHPLKDMIRRVYWIDLYPEVPDPQDRPESDFAHADPRGWTLDNRPELVTAALTMIRAWFAAGQPPYLRGSLMGSFEAWDKMMSGILAWAGVDGFLGNLAARRAERDTTGGYWEEHLDWLVRRFGTGNGFTSLDVKAAAMDSSGTWDGPPHLDEPNKGGFARDLGIAYAGVAGRWFGLSRIVRGEGTAQRKVAKWFVEQRQPTVPPVPPENEMAPDLGRRDSGGIRAPAPARVREEGLEGGEGPPTPGDHARPRERASARSREAAGLGGPSQPSGPSAGLTLGFDLETADAGQLFTRQRGYRGADGTGFVRLAGITGASGAAVIMPVDQLRSVLAAAGSYYGHNILGFDGPALAWHEGWDWEAFCERARDTELIARQVFPPRSREKGHSADKLGLDAVAQLIGIQGKTGDLTEIARKHGGMDQIPLDDPEYVSYLLDGDMPATKGVADFLLPYYDADPYLPREHKLAAIAGRMRLNGLLVDQDLLNERYEAGEKRKRDAAQLLHDGWGLPLGRMVSKGRGDAKHEEFEERKSPLSTDEGRAWLAEQWARYQVPDPPTTAKTGKLALGADDLTAIARDPACPADLRAMITLMNVVTTTRTVYQTARKWLCPDGRVHPGISFRQASGRWSVTDPGLTVFGKHDGKHIERDIFVASPGCSLWSFDLEQVDMRAIAGHCQDPAYMALFEPGRDAHSEIAARVFGEMPRDAKGRHPMRQPAKARGHGWNYGMGPERMIRDGVDPDLAYGFDNGMQAGFPVLCAWRDGVRAIGESGGILDNGFGRRMRCDPRWAYTVAPALIGQGGARDILGECMLRIDPALYKYLLLQVHDELIFELPDSIADEAVPEIKRAMTWDWAPPGASMTVPILVDSSGPGKSWGEISQK